MAESRSQQKLNDGPSYYAQAVSNSLRTPPLGFVVHSHHIRHTYRFKKDIIKYSSLHDSLEHVFSKPLFCCGGSLKPEEMDEFVLEVKPSTSEEDKNNWKEFDLAKGIDVEELLKYCTPATFGDLKEMKTLVDSDVRQANAVESERFKIGLRRRSQGVYPYVPGRESIEKHIENVLTPGRYVKLDHYKLNIYSKGGFFKPHVDSPSGENMIGTLVVCLPSSHKGGELCVNHDGLQHIFDFSSHSEDASRIQWAAFYSNCIHEVKPVLEGNRVTITYNITLDSRKMRSFNYRARYWDANLVSQDENFEASVACPSLATDALNNVHNELEKIRKQKATTGSPSKIGFFLKHKYIPSGLQQSMLKGEDKALFEFLVGKQWKCELKSVLSRYQTDCVYLDGEDRDLDEWHQVYEFNPLPPTTHGSYHTDSTYRRFRTTHRQWRFGIPFIDAYRKEDIDTERLRNNEGSGSWIGNEVEPVGVDKIYLESVVIVHL